MNDPWIELRQYTQARIAQGRAGHSVRTESHLEFQLAHARARDAVRLPWDWQGFAQVLTAKGLRNLVLSTQAQDRMQYLKRPDLGRRLDGASRQRLLDGAGDAVDIALIFSNGLSSTAMETHGAALLDAILAAYALGVDPENSLNPPALAPICLVPDARVALSDEIGSLLQAKLAVMVIGERPGLSAADSLGIYMTYLPHPANTDAERNCISNIRPPEGLSPRQAASKLLYLSRQAFKRGLSGVALKDDMSPTPVVGDFCKTAISAHSTAVPGQSKISSSPAVLFSRLSTSCH